jgi:hypothetical protein
MRLTWQIGSGAKHVLERIQPANLTVSELTSYSGDYFSGELAATYRIRNANGKLIVTVGWNQPVQLQPSLRDEFVGRLSGEFREPIVIQFVHAGNKIAAFDLFAGFAAGVRDIRFVRK